MTMTPNRLPLALFAIASLAAAPALAQEQTLERTFEGPNGSATQATTVDRDAGTLNRERTMTNTNTGNTRTRTLDRERTETGSLVTRSNTGPAGNTRSVSGERVRTENGSTFSGTATGLNGATVGLDSTRTRTGRGSATATQRVTNSDGQTIATRNRTVTRNRNGATRTVTRKRTPR